MKSMSKWLVALVLVVLASNAFAIKANPRPRTLTQPDGSNFRATLMGDEHFHFAEDADGFSMVQNEKGYWTFAKLENGLLVATNLVVGKSKTAYPRHLRPDAQAVADLPQNATKVINWSAEKRHKLSTDFLYGPGLTKASASKVATGRQYMNVVLGDFSDSTFAWYAATEKALQNPYSPFPYDPTAANNHWLATQKWFNFVAYGDSVSPYVADSSVVGSMSNFYFDFTFRKCWWYGAVGGPIATGIARASGVSNDAPASAYYSAALSGADATVDYDNDNNGVADNLILIHPGPGQEESGDTKDIWSMSLGINVSTSDGVNITALIACPQNAQLGVFSHEMFHQIGGPDLYDYGYSGAPWGYWSLMDNGSYNGDKGGDRPAFPGGHLVYDLDGMIQTGVDGWMTSGPTGNTDSISSLYRGDGGYTVAALDSAGAARQGNVTTGIRLWRIRNNNFRDSGQVWFVENRQRNPPYESGLPEAGIIITHIDTRMGGGVRFNDGPPCVRAYYSWVEQPGCDINKVYPTGDTSNYNRMDEVAAYSADDYAIGGYPQTALDSTSIPNSWINQCYTTTPDRTGPFIYNVGREQPYMTFNVLRTGLVVAGAPPLVNYQFNTIKDPAPGNNNTILDPWETDTIRMTFRNEITAITAGAACSLYVVVNPAYVTIKNPSWQAVGAGSIAIGTQAQSGPYVLAVAKDAPRFSNVTFAIKFRSTTPAYNDTFYFNCNISALNVVKTYDFSNIYVGGTDYRYRISPSDVCLYGDTLILTNANLDNAVFQSRLYKVKKSTSNSPLTAADTFGSLNNKVSVNSTNYGGGIDIDPATGTLWWTIEDTVYHSNRGTTLISKFEGPNTDWAGASFMKRMRGLAFGPSVVDTVGTDMTNGDSLLVYWQQLNATSNEMNTDSLMNYRKVASGTTTIARRWAFSDSGWPGAMDAGYGWNAWNGRSIENDGQCIWTSVIDDNMMMRRDGDGKILEMFPGPSATSGYGVYGMAVEHTTAAGVSYAPDGGAGAPAFVPYSKGTKTYLYCSAMGEGKIYKVDITEFVIPTPPDSIKVQTVSTTSNRIIIYKSNAAQQKVAKYYIYRCEDDSVPVAADSIGFKTTGRVAGQVASVDTFYDNAAKTGKASHFYSVLSVNYSGVGDWGASVSAPLLEPSAIELANFVYSVSGYSVQFNWSTSSELNSMTWDLQRSSDGVNFTSVGTLAANGTTNSVHAYSYTDNVPSAGIYYYRLYEVSTTSNSKLVKSEQVTVGNMPVRYELAQNYPNPVGHTATKINFALKNSGQLSLLVYNVLGEQVRTLANGTSPAGFYTINWDGNDDRGQQVSNGIYFYKLIAGDFTATKKLTVLK